MSCYIAFLIFLNFLLVLLIYFLYHGITSVPWVRTPNRVAREMLTLANLTAGERVLDLGSGDGTIVLTAQKMGARGIGIERLWPLVLFSRLRAKFTKHGDGARFIHADFFSGDFPDADVITAYLFPEVNIKLENKILKGYKKGTRIVSRDFLFPGLPLVKNVKSGSHKLLLYVL